ncbi:hypothetical protein GALMADRAFT_1181028 [Galerina marginata CBS 339.88]|uniref:Chromo domain-containing protein n=1 Tax=Galerina marginata (strain CBS 339.88) TaxID=685588 RepID=A0A067TAF9_GALM3|nr:hypothetical protein GALMADRAFT_1181028 [Galerina marginata CBS 339.88]
MCTAGVTKEASPVKQVTDDDVNASSRCARPNCLRPKKKRKKSYVVEEPESSFIVEAFVGRYKKFVGGQGVHEEYLVKWHTYDYHEATWELLENMGLTNPGPLLDAFEQEAETQGIELNDGTEVVLFKEAADAGWTTDRLFVKHE